MKQCAFQWLISNDIAHKEMFFNGLIYPSFDYEYRHQLWNYIYYIVMQLPFILQFMMTSSNGNIFRVTVTFCAGNSPVTDEFPAQRPVTALVFSLICKRFGQTIEQTIERLVIWDDIAIIITPVIPSREFLQTAEQGNADGEQTDL